MIPRIFTEEVLSQDKLVALSSEDAHYLINVLRKNQGDPVLLFNGRNGEWSGTMELPEKRKSSGVHAYVKIIKKTRNPDIQAVGTKIHLMICPIKSKKMQILIEKITELGVDEISFIRSKHTVIDDLNYQKIRSWVKEAIEQSGQLVMPVVNQNILNLKEKMQNWLDIGAENHQITEKNLTIILDQSGESAFNMINPSDFSKIAEISKFSKISILIGPEGGFSKEEISILRQIAQININLNSFRIVKISNNILRTETAAIASVAILKTLFLERYDRDVLIEC